MFIVCIDGLRVLLRGAGMVLADHTIEKRLFGGSFDEVQLQFARQ